MPAGDTSTVILRRRSSSPLHSRGLELLPDVWRLVDDFDVALEELRDCAVPACN
jgi:hypothetical protein